MRHTERELKEFARKIRVGIVEKLSVTVPYFHRIMYCRMIIFAFP